MNQSHRVVTPVDEQWLSETTITDYGEEGTQSKIESKAKSPALKSNSKAS
jgi:hypothetical protein